jgi:hypothetical protein
MVRIPDSCREAPPTSVPVSAEMLFLRGFEIRVVEARADSFEAKS